MSDPAQNDTRSAERRALDERIAAEPQRSPPEMPAGTLAASVETHLARLLRRPRAVAGIVQNGVVHPIDPAVTLPEQSRVIIVAAE